MMMNVRCGDIDGCMREMMGDLHDDPHDLDDGEDDNGCWSW